MLDKTSDFFIEMCLLDPSWKFGVSANLYKKYKKEITCNLEDKIWRVPLNMMNYGHIYPSYEGPVPSSIFEDENFLVLEKPPNIHCHPLSYLENNNILSFLRDSGRGVLLLDVNPTAYDRGLLYRLDFETSGVLIYVKKASLWQNLREHFASLAKEKKYQAVVEGDFLESFEGEHAYFYRPYGPKGQQMKVTPDVHHQMGKMSIRKIRYNLEQNRSLLEIKLETGLRHQIRCTLSHLGYPIVGDNLYGSETRGERLYLHAKTYTLLINGYERTFVSNEGLDHSL